MVIIALAFIFLPGLSIIKKSEDFVVQIMLFYLMLGFFFLILNNRRLILASFFCCGILCLFLKQASNENLVRPEVSKASKISVAHFNLSSITDTYESLKEIVNDAQADVLSFQEVTPDWEVFIRKELQEDYPYIVSFPRIDPFGKCMISKIPINFSDTVQIGTVPNLICNLSLDDEELFVISTNFLPPLDNQLSNTSQNNLETIADLIKTLKNPVIIAGDFNLVYWSDEIRSFRNNARLFNSRRDASESGFKAAYDHIFYSRELECTGFNEIYDFATHIGIIGYYQKKIETATQSSIKDYN
jgi:endonuclease/exonuclease/phosphatase (EEP) superfamily protein YafD